jgi:hypothetical protein
MPITFRSAATVAQSAAPSVALTLPAGLVPGDALLAILHVGGGSGTAISPPSGWDLLQRTNDGTAEATAVYARRYTAGLAALHTWTLTSAPVVAHLLAYAGVDQLAALDVAGGQANASSTSCTAPSVTTTKNSALLVACFGGAMGSVSATPPSGMSQRAGATASGLSLTVADALQGTAGASGTKVATLSAATANIGLLLALAPSALNSASAVRDEGNWRRDGWDPRLATETAMDAFVDGLIQRANAELRARAAPAFYAAYVAADPFQGLFKAAEMHLAQALLLDAAAQITEAGDDNNPAPFLGTGEQLRALAGLRRARAASMLASAAALAAGRPAMTEEGNPWLPAFRTATTTAPARDLFDDERGLQNTET